MRVLRLRAAFLAGFLIGSASLTAAGAPLEADPHELYERARARLEAGRLDEAAALLQKLHALIAARPEWDPDGTFARDLAPPLQARLGRLQDAAAALDGFCDNALKDVRPPDFKQDLSTVKDYTHWATAEVAHLRSERDALLAQRLPNPDDAALFTRTDSYARSERLLEVDLLAKMSDAAGDDILGLLSGDPRLEAVLTRFRQLKRDLIDASAERDRLQARLAESETRDRALLGVLDALLGDTSKANAETNVGEHLARVVLARRDALLHHKRLNDAERALFEADLARYRLANRLIVAAGLGSDQRGALARLERTLAGVPPDQAPIAAEPAPAAPEAAPAPHSGSRGWIAAGGFALLCFAAALLKSFALRRRRPEPWTGDETQPIDDIRSGGADAGRRAA